VLQVQVLNQSNSNGVGPAAAQPGRSSQAPSQEARAFDQFTNEMNAIIAILENLGSANGTTNSGSGSTGRGGSAGTSPAMAAQFSNAPGMTNPTDASLFAAALLNLTAQPPLPAVPNAPTAIQVNTGATDPLNTVVAPLASNGILLMSGGVDPQQVDDEPEQMIPEWWWGPVNAEDTTSLQTSMLSESTPLPALAWTLPVWSNDRMVGEENEIPALQGDSTLIQDENDSQLPSLALASVVFVGFMGSTYVGGFVAEERNRRKPALSVGIPGKDELR